uniref:NADH-ubiquinone oxidoreductase chain 4 n=1 Tax=Incoltorrida madagassica TaxID=442089 RepID=A0A343A3L6_9COLE|nr:NADH dehydrogenase subunit 4 [Incoltorrida madagassica]AOY39144.1 NADH dehydrogenase subunit 4 [Incoltorrida madagassica]
MFFLIFMIPLSLKNYWIFQCVMMMGGFMFMLSGGFYSMYCNISYMFGCDLLSYSLILLSFWVIMLMVMASEVINKKKYYLNLFMFMLLMLMLILFLTFSVMNLFLFYLFFESSLIPTLFLILGWGYQPERLQAGVYLLFYTLFASLPMLLGIFFLYKNINTLNFFFFYNLNNFMLYISLILAFFIKMPMYLFHLWLPKAHVEAPVSGSMILAGILLKLGGYGLMRVLKLFIEINMKMNFFWIIISLMGGFIISLMCLRQTDIKMMIAYSSVAHMGLVLSGLMTMNYWGMCGSFMMMIAHGLCSSGMFCLININYERLNSRSLFLNKGMINIMPSMSLWWFLLSTSNMAAPPSLNLISEISLFNSLISWSWMSLFFIMFISFFSAGYSLYLYSFVQHGKYYLGKYSYNLGYVREYLLLMLHWLPLNIMFLKSNLFFFWI